MPSNNDMKFALESIVLGWNIIKNHHQSRPKSTGLSDWEQLRLEIAEHALLDTPKYVHQFLTSNGEWDTVTNDDGTPSTFDTYDAAMDDMGMFFLEAGEAAVRGDMDAINRADWRVSELEVKS